MGRHDELHARRLRHTATPPSTLFTSPLNATRPRARSAAGMIISDQSWGACSRTSLESVQVRSRVRAARVSVRAQASRPAPLSFSVRSCASRSLTYVATHKLSVGVPAYVKSACGAMSQCIGIYFRSDCVLLGQRDALDQPSRENERQYETGARAPKQRHRDTAKTKVTGDDQPAGHVTLNELHVITLQASSRSVCTSK